LHLINEQDEAGTAAIKTVELDAALGGRAVQYREVQGNETEKFLSYFKPCIIPEEGGVASGFRHAEVNQREHVTRLFVCRGKHTVHVKEVNTIYCVPCLFFLCILSLCPFMVLAAKY
jgi:gelsolin